MPKKKMATDDGQASNRFPDCKICGKTIKSHMKQHLRIHQGEKPYKCRHCGKRFLQRGYCIIHERLHTGEKPYKCQFCVKRFNQRVQCRYHEKSHTGEKLFQCQYCSKTFITVTERTVHERSHTGEKPYRCPYCGKMFATSSSRKAHTRTHTGEKPYNCSHCNKAFFTSRSRLRHEKIHTGDKKYACRHCGKNFIQAGHRTSHERIHTGEKPYTCSTCGKTFSRDSNRKRHEETHGRGEESVETIEPAGECDAPPRLSPVYEPVHRPPEQKKFSCRFCGKTFSKTSNCKRHEAIHARNGRLQNPPRSGLLENQPRAENDDQEFGDVKGDDEASEIPDLNCANENDVRCNCGNCRQRADCGTNDAWSRGRAGTEEPPGGSVENRLDHGVTRTVGSHLAKNGGCDDRSSLAQSPFSWCIKRVQISQTCARGLIKVEEVGDSASCCGSQTPELGTRMKQEPDGIEDESARCHQNTSTCVRDPSNCGHEPSNIISGVQIKQEVTSDTEGDDGGQEVGEIVSGVKLEVESVPD